MTARVTLALVIAAAAMLAALVVKLMAVSVLAGTLLACVLALLTGCYLTWRAIGTGGGQHAAPRGGPLFQAPRLASAAPAVVTRAQPPWPPAAHSADWDTRAMPGYVADAIGHGGDIDAAVDSMWTRALGRQLGEQIRGGEL
jgi:hypothetical protein